MSFESDIFKRCKADFDKIRRFGFVENDGAFNYSESFLDGSFRADIVVQSDGNVFGKVVDTEIEDEYFAFRSELRTGEFVGKVREAYSDILHKIKENCFISVPFRFYQSNRIALKIYNVYGEEPDYPFRNLPDCGVFRHASNSKWYGLIMNIPKNKLTKRAEDNSEQIEIINIKVNSDKLTQILEEAGIYPCYHMNKGNWVSIILDDTVGDERIMELIDESRCLIAGKRFSKESPESRWIIPANPKYYDLENDFKVGKSNLWKQGRGIKSGDIVYIYVGVPIAAIMYKCKVLESQIPYEYSDEHISMSHVMKMEVLKVYDRSLCGIEKMKSFGVMRVRGARFMPEDLENYLNDAEC